MNWKHKVTPDWGDLNIQLLVDLGVKHRKHAFVPPLQWHHLMTRKESACETIPSNRCQNNDWGQEFSVVSLSTKDVSELITTIPCRAWRHYSRSWQDLKPQPCLLSPSKMVSKSFNRVWTNCYKFWRWLGFIIMPTLESFFLAATKQLYKWYFPSVCLSVCHTFWLCSHHRIIVKFSGVITNDQSKVHAKGQGQRSKVKVTEVITQLNRFRTVTPVWIDIWWGNDAYSLMLLRSGALLFFKVIRQISRSNGSKNRRIWPRLGVSGL